MTKKLVLILVFLILITTELVAASEVRAQTVFVTVPYSRSSVRNQIIDFYAGGSSGGYTLRMSPQGGTLSINGYGDTGLTPWGYVTAKWSLGEVYIIFVANVTQSDFRIGFLYLTNVTDEAFILRWFDYGSGMLNDWTFQGAQHVYNRTVMTTPTPMPRLKIATAPTATNAISALGTNLYLTSRGGQLINGTTSLNIYPLMNQLYGGSTDYNEVWSLLADDAGNYYFAILYAQNSDHSRVIVEHQLRLNDYARLNGITVGATWEKGTFSNYVTVRTGMSNVMVKVDGFPFETNARGIVSLGVPNGRVNIQVPNEMQDVPGSRLRFISWSNYGVANPLSLILNSSIDITANYTREHPLLITSSYGNAAGSGWYAQGSNVTFSVPEQVILGNGTRRVFERWQGDSNSTSNMTWAIMNTPKNVIAIWKTQYEVTVKPAGLPENASAKVVVDNSIVNVNASAPYLVWVDAGAQLGIGVQSTQVADSGTNYVFTALQVNNQTIPNTVAVTKPLNVVVMFTSSPKAITSVNLQVAPTVAAAGFPISIRGSVQGLTGESTFVSLLYSPDQFDWIKIANVTLSPDGTFLYGWHSVNPGEYYVKASWPGDSKHAGSSSTVSLRVLDSTIPIPVNSLTELLHPIKSALGTVPYVPQLLTVAGSMMSLGYVMTTFLIPGGSPLIGYFIGSLLVGLVYVFPVTAVLAVLNTIRSRRAPRTIWLIPLVTVWIGSLVIVIANLLSFVSGPLILAAETLLFLCNILLVPMLAGFRLARMISS